MKIVCDACQAKYSIADDKIQGKAFKIRCKKCGHIIVVKTGGEGAAASTAAAAASDKSKAAAASAPAADQGAWHVVVDGEQVGPLTEAEVKDRLRQGQINSDTLVWKEGFADWSALSTVPELATLLARITHHSVPKPASAEAARPSGSMRDVAASAAAAAEADPFGGATVITPAGTADLFASAGAQAAVPATVAPAPSSPFLFGGGASQAAEPMVVTKPTGNGAGSTHLTGQRNENSVLFSLSNLEALAVPSQSGGIRAPSSTANTEGSGLIDIRSMAAMTLNDGGAGEGRRSSDALPTFSTPQFSPVAPVLLPMSSSGPPKWVYPVLGLLAVGILVLGYGIYKVAAAPPPGLAPVVVVPPPAPVAPPVAQPAPGQPAVANPTPPPTGETAKATAPEAKPTPEEKAADKNEKGKTSSGKGDKGHRKGSETASGKGTGDSKKGGDSASASASSTPQPSSGAAKTTGKGKGAKSLDDLLGEVGNKKGGDEGPKPAPASKPLMTLTQSDIVNAMKSVQPKVQACANQFKVPGTAMASISIASGGKVNSATVTGKFAGTPSGSCVEAAAKSAKFPPCQSMTFPWPFTLSPR